LLGWLMVQVALAEPLAVVAIGDGLVAPATPPATASSATASVAPATGWVSVLADCLEERAAGRFSVVDRVAQGQTPAAARATLDGVYALGPKLVLVGLAAPRAADTSAWRTDVDALLGALSAKVPAVMLVGVGDGTSAAWSAALADFAKSHPMVVNVPVGADVAVLDGGTLSDQGHARLGAAVCDAVMVWQTRP
jgi:hypothetical protein